MHIRMYVYIRICVDILLLCKLAVIQGVDPHVGNMVFAHVLRLTLAHSVPSPCSYCYTIMTKGLICQCE